MNLTLDTPMTDSTTSNPTAPKGARQYRITSNPMVHSPSMMRLAQREFRSGSVGWAVDFMRGLAGDAITAAEALGLLQYPERVTLNADTVDITV